MNNVYISMVEFRETLKLFHFQCPTFAQHKASDALINSFDEKFDKFWELYQGIYDRLTINSFNIIINKKNLKEINKETIELKLMLQFLDLKDLDLSNIRDEIIGELNQFLYLLTFK